MVKRLIKLILRIFPDDLVWDINDLSLKELDKPGWIIWAKDYDKN